MSYNVQTIDLGKQTPEKVRVMICQFDARELNISKKNHHLVIENNIRIRKYVDDLLKVAQTNNVKLVVFPELSIPEELIGHLVSYSKANQCYIFAGTRYKNDIPQGVLSIGTMVTPENTYEFHKINPSPNEQIPILRYNVNKGRIIYNFINTEIGNFAITICADYMDNTLKKSLRISNLDLLIVPSFHNHSEEYFARMNSDIIDSKSGLYILYSNFCGHDYADGKSALFGAMDSDYLRVLQEASYTNCLPKTKLLEFSDGQRYAIFDLDLRMKKPVKVRGIQNGVNVLINSIDAREKNIDYDFIHAIGQNSDVIRNVEKFYVEPNEFEKIKDSLDEKNIVLILGDPGIGKTYTAIKLLFDYFKKGYTVRWISSLKREEREIQIAKISECEPTCNEIFYIEDPFGRTCFENRAEIKEILLPLIYRFKNSQSKLIITSRSEVFDSFSKETLNSHMLLEYSEEINIRRPSYSVSKLLLIVKVYIDYYTSWKNKQVIIKIFEKYIKSRRLLSPYSIYNIIRSFSKEPSVLELEECIFQFTNRDLSIPYSEGIKKLSVSHIIGLYVVYFLSGESFSMMQEVYNRAQSQICSQMSTIGLAFSSILETQQGYRITQMGRIRPSFRLAHPIIEDVMLKLYETDDKCKSIATAIYAIIFQNNTSKSVKILMKHLSMHAQVALRLYSFISMNGFTNTIDEEQKVELCSKMLNSKNQSFINEARILLPIDILVNNMYETSLYDNTFLLKIRMLYIRKSEIEEKRLMIRWENIFTKSRIRQMNQTIFANSLRYAFQIDNNIGFQLERSYTNFEIQRLYIMQKLQSLRDMILDVFRLTKYESILSSTKQTMASIGNGKSVNRMRYKDIIWSDALKMEKINGSIYLDDGAIRKAYRKANIYLVGVIGVKGFFQAGDIVNICDRMGRIRFYTVAELPSRFIHSYKGMRTNDICEHTGDSIAPAIVSRSSFRSNPISNK